MRDVVILDHYKPKTTNITLTDLSRLFATVPETRFHLFIERGLIQRDSPLGHAFSTIHEIDNYLYGGQMEAAVAEFCSRREVSLIYAGDEYTLLRAARIRDRFGIPGQSLESALTYRDKLRMKQRAQAAGVPALPCREVGSIVDLLQAREEFGFPFVVKPRTGASEDGFRLLRSGRDVDEYIADLGKTHFMDDPLYLLAEPCCAFPQWHVDGLFRDGRVYYITASQYTGADVIHEPPFERYGISGSMMYGPEEPLARQAIGVATKLLLAFPTPRHCAFHIELWLSDQGTFLLGEAAARAGGMMIFDMFRASSGVFPDTAWLACELGLPEEAGFLPRFQRCSRGVRVPWRTGRVVAVPEHLDIPFLFSYDPIVKKGDVLKPATKWYHNLAQGVVVGASREETRQRGDEFIKIFLDRSVIEPA